jgi:uncharacterized protein YndB with AHSA1/START domain
LRAILLAAVLATPTGAAVVRSAPDSFVIEHRLPIAKPPAAAWDALVDWAGWWPDAHTYSGKAANLDLDLEPNGELEEEWDEDRMVLHAIVLQAIPPERLRLSGGFGPLQSIPLNAIMDFSLKPEGEGTTLLLRYHAAGPASAGLDALAPAVDAVLAEALARLATHTPEPDEDGDEDD